MPLHPDFQKILDSFREEYGEEEGERRFWAWVRSHKYDETKSMAYNQRREGVAFTYTASITPLEKDGKHYARIYAIDTTMNRNRWGVTQDGLHRALKRLPGTAVLGPPEEGHRSKWTVGRVSDYAANGEVWIDVEVTDPEAWKHIESGEWKYVSPKVMALDVVETPLGEWLDTFDWVHFAFVEDPAYPSARVLDTFEAGGCDFWPSFEAAYYGAFGDTSFPDSCFLWVPEEAKGPDGKKSLRKLPVRNKDGSLSCPHVRNALARLDQTEGIPPAEKEKIRKKLHRLMKECNPDYVPPGERQGHRGDRTARDDEANHNKIGGKRKLPEDKPERDFEAELKAKDEEIGELTEKIGELEGKLKESENPPEVEERLKVLEAENKDLKARIARFEEEKHLARIAELLDRREKAGLCQDRQAELERFRKYPSEVLEQMIEDTERMVKLASVVRGPKAKYTAEQVNRRVEDVREALLGYRKKEGE